MKRRKQLPFTLWEDGYPLRNFPTKQEAIEYANRNGIIPDDIRYKGHPIAQLTPDEIMSTPALY